MSRICRVESKLYGQPTIAFERVDKYGRSRRTYQPTPSSVERYCRLMLIEEHMSGQEITRN